MEIERPVSDTARVLVVDDEPLLADLITEWVVEKWRCETVHTGSDAIESVNEEIDVVLLDRNLPDIPGDEVLERIREDVQSIQVAMVSAVEPDFDIVDMPIDDYLEKPVDRPSVQAKVEELLLRRTYHPPLEWFFVHAAKLDVLESAMSAVELANDERYHLLRARADEIRQDADATLGRMTGPVAGLYDFEADD